MMSAANNSSTSPDVPARSRYFLASIAFLLALAVVLLVVRPLLFPDRKQRNVILIVADALRADHLGCYGFERPLTPVIDDLAAGGVLFTECNTVVPSTLASFMSLFTSRHPKDHGASRNGFKPLDGLPTLAGAFSREGYETAAFIASYAIHSEFGTSRGFDHFDERMTQTTVLFDNKLIRSASEVTDAFMQWLTARNDEKPFFAMIHYFDPHFPYRPPVRFLQPPVIREPEPGREAMEKATMRDISSAIKALKESGGKPDDFAESLHDLYCAEIRFMDEQIGRVVERFRGEGKDENETLIIFTADHGETFWEHAEYFGHGETVFDTGIKIPLIFNCPGFVPPRIRDETPLSNLDTAPTLCRLADVAPPNGFEGESFADLVRGGGEPGGAGGLDPMRLRYAEATKPYQAEEGAPRPNILKAKSVRRGPWKYIETPFANGDGALYNLAEDPDELADLAGREENAVRVKALKDELWRWAKTYDPARSGGQTIDPEVQKRLEGLGY